MTRLCLAPVTNADALALAAAVRRLPKAYRLGADRVAQVVRDHSALDPAAIEAVAATPFSLSARSSMAPS